LFFAPALAVAFTFTSASALTWVLLMACAVEFVVAAVVAFAVEVLALAVAVVAFAVAVAAFAVEAVACVVACVVAWVVAWVVAEEALSALLTDGVPTAAAELNLAELPRPRRTWAKEWLEIAKEAMMMEVIAIRFIIPDLSC
jgi:hypothetical protein